MRLKCILDESFDVHVTSRVLDPSNSILAESAATDRGLVVVDAAVATRYGRSLDAYLDARMPGFARTVLKPAEATKTTDTVLRLCAEAVAHRLGRRDTLVAVGGGIVCDVVSVAGSLIRRGIPYVTVPTTLVSQVDAGIGLKGAVNFDGNKNYLGSFRPPASVVVDPSFLQTLPVEELSSGMAEIVKIALVRDPRLVEDLLQHGPDLMVTRFAVTPAHSVISRSIALMLDELAENPYERVSLRRLVDFGHTVGPRLEELSRWSMRHGESVAIDMAFSSALAVEVGLLAESDYRRIVTLLTRLGLPVTSPLLTAESVRQSIVAATQHRAGYLNLVVPVGLGRATFLNSPDDLTDDAVDRALSRIRTEDADGGRIRAEPALNAP